LAREAGADQGVWSRLYEPYARRRDAAVEEKLKKLGLSVKTFNASLLFEPWEIATKAGGPFKVFTPFSKACLGRDVALPLGEVQGKRKRKETNGTPSCAGVTVKGKWASGLKAFWKVGEKAAQERLHLFTDEIMGGYKAVRDRPDLDGTSLLSPYLHFGHLSPRQVWHAVRHAMAVRKSAGQGGEAFLRQLLWREFAYHLLWHFPDLPEKPLQTSFAKFPWRKDSAATESWQKGLTVIPSFMQVCASFADDEIIASIDRRLLLVKTFCCRGKMGRRGFGIRWSMPIWPIMPSAGNGSAGAGPIRLLISEFLTPFCRGKSSIRTVPMCGAMSLNLKGLKAIRFICLGFWVSLP
jgi:hypothetical protein